jgi:Flp pilus assembly protein TadD
MPASRFLVSRLAVLVAAAATLSACAQQPRPEITGSIGVPMQQSEEQWRQQADALAARYKAELNDPAVAMSYARALRETGQRAQAAAVLQQASIRNPRDRAVLGAYGRALADAGRLREALDILGKAHTPDQPDWRILNAQGAVLDQMGKHAEAQRYYETALRMEPSEPAILSNLGLSYALSKNLERAEETLRRAAADPRAEQKVKQNLGVVLALRAKFEEAEKVTTTVLPAEQARSNVAYFREMIGEQPRGAKAAAPRKTAQAG